MVVSLKNQTENLKLKIFFCLFLLRKLFLELPNDEINLIEVFLFFCILKCLSHIVDIYSDILPKKCDHEMFYVDF
jgi:hypothetical protein